MSLEDVLRVAQCFFELQCKNLTGKLFQSPFTNKPRRVNANIGKILRVKLKVVKVVKFKYIYYI